jgi:uncharacterized phage protein (TIGR01671 family)
MREIKFRAWDAEIKEMHYLDKINFNLKYGYYQDDNAEWGRVELENCMQYTGLKDKNGKEIYEGDIIGVPYINPMGGIDDKYDPDTVYPVIFEYGEFALKRSNSNQSLMDWLKKGTGEYIPNYGNRRIVTDEFIGEVIGNIYENPELIK